MTTAENSDSVVPFPRWWSAVKNAWAKVPRLLRGIFVWPSYLVSVSIPIAAGAYMFAAHWGRADPEYLFTTSYSQYPGFLRSLPPFLATALREALGYDGWVIVGYFLVLITCALVFMALAFSRSGKKLSQFILAAVLVATAAHILEDGLIRWVLDRPGRLGGL
jgi:hypothetical protein